MAGLHDHIGLYDSALKLGVALADFIEGKYLGILADGAESGGVGKRSHLGLGVRGVASTMDGERVDRRTGETRKYQFQKSGRGPFTQHSCALGVESSKTLLGSISNSWNGHEHSLTYCPVALHSTARTPSL